MPTRRALRLVVWAEVVLLGVLATTGLWLSRYYRPTQVRVYSFETHGLQSSIAWAARIRWLHTFSGSLFIWTALIVLALSIGVAVEDKTAPRSRVWILGAAFAVMAWGTSFTGYLLPWDQLALRAVTIGSHFNGMWSAAFSDNIRFVLMGNSEITQSTLRTWFLVHAFVLGPALGAGLVLLVRRVRD